MVQMTIRKRSSLILFPTRTIITTKATKQHDTHWTPFILNTSHAHSLTTTLSGRYSYCFQFIDEETEIQANNLPKINQLAIGRDRIQTQAASFRSPGS